MFSILCQGEEVFFVKGAIERILKQCRRYHNKSSLSSMTMKDEQSFLTEASQMGRAGLRGMTQQNQVSLSLLPDGGLRGMTQQNQVSLCLHATNVY